MLATRVAATMARVRVAQQSVEPSQHRRVERGEVQLGVPLAAEPVARPQALAGAEVGAGVVGDDVVAHGQRHPYGQAHQHGQGNLLAVPQPPHEGADVRDRGHLAAQGSQPWGGAQSRRAEGRLPPPGPSPYAGRRSVRAGPAAGLPRRTLRSSCPRTARPPAQERRIRQGALPVLAELAVRDLGVIDEVTLLLDPGMTALTGETGAGKTMLVGAIGLLAGDRADAAVVRPGADEATVQGRFVVDGDEVVLTRVVPRTGRSRAYRDGRLITAAELSELAAGLVDLHGQHAHVGLLTTASQRRALDRFAGVDLHDLEAARRARRAADEELERLGGDAAARDRERDFLRFQLDEIESAGLTDDGEDERLLAEESILGDADAHREAGSAADAALSTERGARDRVATALAELGERSPFAAVVARLRAVEADLADITHELRTVAEDIEGDPERLAAVQERRAQLADLRRRYSGDARSTLAELFAVRDELSRRLVELDSHADRAAAAEADRAQADADVAVAAAAVGARRRDHAPALAREVRERLHELALAKADVRLDVGDDDPGDDVSFLLALNPGMPMAPLAKAASGGELARTMLALRLIVGARVPTLVFDEVDAGVGGAAARSVGRALAALATDKQVLVVTHLPQVAAFADAQVALTKQDDGVSTVMRAEVLGAEPRVRELARMLSGLADSDTGQDHAEELLATAAAERGR